MPESYGRRGLLNLLLALAAVIPVWRIGLYLITLAAGAPRDAHEAVDFAFYFVILTPQILLGSLLQQLLLAVILPRLRVHAWRSVAVASTVILPLVLIVLRRGDPGLLLAPPVIAPLAAGLLTYGILFRLPPNPEKIGNDQAGTSTAT